MKNQPKKWMMYVLNHVIMIDEWTTTPFKLHKSYGQVYIGVWVGTHMVVYIGCWVGMSILTYLVGYKYLLLFLQFRHLGKN
jgi:hypothetical protein